MTQQHSEALVEATVGSNGAAVVNAPVGKLVADCHIDLPPNDVVDSIDFERFFRISATLGQIAPNAAGKVGDAERVAAASHDLGNQTHVRGPVPAAAPQTGAFADIPGLRLALYMPFRQDWILNGYDRGRVVNAFTLCPGEEQTVEIFTWDRQTRSVTSSMSFETDQTQEASGTRRDTVDVAHDVTQQAGFDMHSNGNVGFTVGVVNVQLGGGMGANASINDAQKSTMNAIVEATSHSLNNVRTSRTLSVSESRETGREDRVTRKLANPNACHTLTIPFFEILANYTIATYLRTSEVKLVVLLQTSGLANIHAVFTRDDIREHEMTLRLALLDSTLADGFEAAKLLDARDRACGVLCNTCSCDDDAAGDDSQLWNDVVAAAPDVIAAAAAVRGRSILFPASVPGALIGGGIPSAVDDIEAYLFRKTLEKNARTLISGVLATGITPMTPGPPVTTAQARQLNALLQSAPIALLMFDPVVSNGVGSEIEHTLYLAALFGGADPLIAAPIITTVQFGILKGNTNQLTTYEDDGLVAAISRFLGAYAKWAADVAAKKQQSDREVELARIARAERDARLLETFGLREVATAEERLDALLAHLNDSRNTNHYRFAVWNERGAAVDDAVINLALTGLIDPTAVGIVGDDLAVPLRLDSFPELQAFYDGALADLVKNTPIDRRPALLPTAALYAEAIVGHCSACENAIGVRTRLEEDRLRIANDHAKLENKRLDARITAGNLELDPPAPAQVSLHVDGELPALTG